MAECDGQQSLDIDVPEAHDPETDRTILVTLKIPFYGKKHQAVDFLENRLPRILTSGIGDGVVVQKAKISS